MHSLQSKFLALAAVVEHGPSGTYPRLNAVQTMALAAWSQMGAWVDHWLGQRRGHGTGAIALLGRRGLAATGQCHLRLGKFGHPRHTKEVEPFLVV